MSDKENYSSAEYLTNDSVPSSASEFPQKRKEYKKEIKEYTKKWCARYKKLSHLTAHTIWIDFISNFSTTAVYHLKNVEAPMLRNILIENGIYVKPRRGISRKHALKDVFEAQDYP